MSLGSDKVPNVVIHIGASKCGSSAIQKFLARNVEPLRRRGFLVPDAHCQHGGKILGQQIWFFQNLLAFPPPLAREKVASALDALRQYMRVQGLHTIVLSGENLANPYGFSEFFAGSLEAFNFRVVMYIRRQDDWLISGWQQWGVKVHENFASWCEQGAGKWVDWDACLRQWESVFGTERVSVRLFERDRLIKRDAVADFLSLLGLDECDFESSAGTANRSFEDAVTLLSGRLRDLFRDEHDNDLYDMLVRYCGSAVFKQGRASALMSLDERREVFETYAAGNRAVKQRYFSEDATVPETLFPAPSGADVSSLSDEEALQRSVDHLFRVVFGLYKDIEVLRKK